MSTSAKEKVQNEIVKTKTTKSRLVSAMWKSLPPDVSLLLLATIVGAGGGASVTLFKTLMRLVSDLSYGDFLAGNLLETFGRYNIIFIPTFGGLIVSIIRFRLPNLGAGLNEIIEQVKQGKPMNVLQVVLKSLAAVVTLGPSVELGATVSRFLASWFRLSAEKQRLILATGAAAGFAAGFNAPIAGVFFSMEVVLGSSLLHSNLDTTGSSAVAMLLLSSAMSALISQAGLGSSPAFSLPKYDILSPVVELPLYLLLGLLAGVASLGVKYSLRIGNAFFQGNLSGFSWMKDIPLAVKPFLGGLCNGLTALYFPQILFFGYDTLDALLADIDFPLSLLLTLLFLKPFITSLSLGSGLIGGTFAPTLFVGATLGASYAKLLNQLDYSVIAFLHNALGSSYASGLANFLRIAGPPAYSMVGMAAVLSGVFRAPLTSSLLLFELTRDYRIVLPLMASAGLSSWLVDTVEQQWMRKLGSIDKIHSLKSSTFLLDTPKEKKVSLSDKSLNFASSSLTIPTFELGQPPSKEEQQLLQRLPARLALNETFTCLSVQTWVLDAVHCLLQRQQCFAVVIDGTTFQNVTLPQIQGIFSLRDFSTSAFSLLAGNGSFGPTNEEQRSQSQRTDAFSGNKIEKNNFQSLQAPYLWEQNLSYFCQEPWIFVEDNASLAHAYHLLMSHRVQQALIIQHETKHLIGWLDYASISKAFTMQVTNWVIQRVSSK
eukprot:jgi/Galph1/5123/GphlegSOOS_G3706.1